LRHIFYDIRLDDADFDDIGTQIDDMPFVHHGKVGAADCRLMPMRAAVDFVLTLPSFAARRRSAGALAASNSSDLRAPPRSGRDWARNPADA
jgi:hypothetical protein